MKAHVVVMGLLALHLVTGALAQDATSGSRSDVPKGTAQNPTTLKSQNAARKSTRNLGFHGIAVGQRISALPFQCNAPRADCDGIVAGNFVKVSVWDSTVTRVEVIYKGITSRTLQLIEAPPISLAQAVRLHSLQIGAKLPALRYAPESFFVDSSNRIVYMTTGS